MGTGRRLNSQCQFDLCRYVRMINKLILEKADKARRDAGNSAYQDGGAAMLNGVAMRTLYGTSSIIIKQNKAGRNGGGLCTVLASSVVFEGKEAVFVGNQANQGGGIYLYSAALVFVGNGLLEDNSAASAGGGIFGVNSATVTVEASCSLQISNNNCGQQGAGIALVVGSYWSSGGRVVVTGSLLVLAHRAI